MLYSDSFDSALSEREIEVMLDGLRVGIPCGRRSLAAIRSYLDTLAMEHQRILCSFNVDGEPADEAKVAGHKGTFCRIEAETIDLEEMPAQIIQTALEQAAHARVRVESAITLVLINDGVVAREFWWELSQALKLPLVTLAMLPETICGPANGHVSMVQLRKWQLQQLAALIKDVDEACWSDDVSVLSNALENRVLPWLDRIQQLMLLWRETALAGLRLRAQREAAAI